MSLQRLKSRRTVAPLAILSASALMLTGCMPGFGPQAPNVVGFDDIQSATIEISGQGTFIEPGTLNSSEAAWHGSGFIIDPSGIAITNNHVVVGAGKLDARIGGDADQEVGVQVLGASECLDLAVVQLGGEVFPRFGWYEGEITTGLDVYSAGFPSGYADEFTLTRGIVSKADFELDTQWAALSHVIEHDARIRGGNSGGPLVTADGLVVGVNYAGDDSLDYNFAIHRNTVREVVTDLAAGERVLSIGINARAWASDDQELWGVWVSSVEAGGPADQAGIAPGDLILKLAGVSVGDDGTLGSYCQVLDTHGPEGTFDVEIYRPGDDSLLAGQINGRPLSVTGTDVFGGGSNGSSSGGSELSGSFTSVSDDLQVVTVEVPAEWRDFDGSPWTDDNGRDWSSIHVAPNLRAFYDSFDAPGLILEATDPSLTPEAALQEWDWSDQCTLYDSGDYDDGFYAGVFADYDCGTNTQLLVIATQDYAKTGTLVLLGQFTTETEKTTVLDRIIETFRLV